MATKKKPAKPKLGECCPLFDPIIRRDGSKQAPRGFEVATPYHFPTGQLLPEKLIYRFPKAARGVSDALGHATYADVKFCPFCGVKQGEG